MRSDSSIDVGDRRAEAGAGVPLRSTLVALMVFYAAAMLLNGRHLHEAAARRPYGPGRTFWMALTAPFHHAAVTLRLDAFRARFEILQE